MRAKKEEELEEVKRRAAEEAHRSRLEKQGEVDVEREDEDIKLFDEGQSEEKVEALTKQEEETGEEMKDGVKPGGEYSIYDKYYEDMVPQCNSSIKLYHLT